MIHLIIFGLTFIAGLQAEIAHISLLKISESDQVVVLYGMKEGGLDAAHKDLILKMLRKCDSVEAKTHITLDLIPKDQFSFIKDDLHDAISSLSFKNTRIYAVQVPYGCWLTECFLQKKEQEEDLSVEQFLMVNGKPNHTLFADMGRLIDDIRLSNRRAQELLNCRLPIVDRMQEQLGRSVKYYNRASEWLRDRERADRHLLFRDYKTILSNTFQFSAVLADLHRALILSAMLQYSFDSVKLIVFAAQDICNALAADFQAVGYTKHTLSNVDADVMEIFFQEHLWNEL